MKRVLFVTVALWVVIAIQAYAFGNPVSSFSPPGNHPTGVAFLSNTLYLDTRVPDWCWETSTTGSVTSSFAPPGTVTLGTAVGSIGGTLYRWVVNHHDPKLIYRVVATTGSTVGSFAAPGLYPYGVGFRGPSYIYYTAFESRIIYLMHATTGSVYDSYLLSFQPTGLAYDPAGYLWVADRYNYLVRRLTLTGSPMASFSVKAYGKAAGLGCGGGFVWVGFDSPVHVVVQFTASGSGVTPASLGRVKSLFR